MTRISPSTNTLTAKSCTATTFLLHLQNLTKMILLTVHIRRTLQTSIAANDTHTKPYTFTSLRPNMNFIPCSCFHIRHRLTWFYTNTMHCATRHQQTYTVPHQSCKSMAAKPFCHSITCLFSMVFSKSIFLLAMKGFHYIFTVFPRLTIILTTPQVNAFYVPSSQHDPPPPFFCPRPEATYICIYIYTCILFFHCRHASLSHHIHYEALLKYSGSSFLDFFLPQFATIASPMIAAGAAY